MSGYIILSQLRLPSPTSVWCVSGEGLVLQLGLGRPVPTTVLVAKLCARKQPPTAGNEFLLIAAVPGAGLPCLSSEGRKTKTLKNGVMSRSSYLMRGNAAFFYLKAQIFFFYYSGWLLLLIIPLNSMFIFSFLQPFLSCFLFFSPLIDAKLLFSVIFIYLVY